MAQSKYHNASGRSTSTDFYNTIFAAQSNKETRIVLAGKTGEGKSALGNAILGKQNFVAKRSMRSETSVCLAGECYFDGRRLIVVDTPGLFDTNAEPKHVAQEIGKAVIMSAPGPHCFIITISARNRFTAEAQQTINLLCNIFGGDVLDYCIVVFTNEDAITDDNVSFEHWLPEQARHLPGLAQLINSCGRRCLAFNSNSKSKDELDQKVGQLLSMIDRMVAQNDGRIYTNDMYKQAEAAARQREEEQLREAAEKDAKIQREMEKLKKQFQEAKAELEEAQRNNKDQRKAQRARIKAEEEYNRQLQGLREESERNKQEAERKATEARRETREKTESGSFSVFTVIGKGLDTIADGVITATKAVANTVWTGICTVGKWLS